LAGIFGIIKAFQTWRKNIADTKREAVALNGITEKGAKEAGIEYKTITDRVKELKEEQKLAADKAKAYFESYTKSGVTGLTLTIQQLKELKERVKTDMPETMEILNRIDSSKVNEWASNLKAQMVASGKSVQEATNLIYALIESSNKAGRGVNAISNQAFVGITDKGSAASFIMKNLAKNIDDVAKIDPSAFASNVDSAINSLDSAVQSLVGTKDATGDTIDAVEAITLQFEKMTNAGIKNKMLGQQTLEVLKAQRPELAGILNQSDTIGGLYAKWRLFLQGVSIDLSKISSAQAETLATFTAALDAAGQQALASKGTVKGLENARGLLETLREDYKKAEKAANANSVSAAGLSKKQIKAINDEIKAIRERADAKKKALRETFDRENAELELQKAKLDLQNAVARGDNEAAAAAQIRIQQIQKETSLKAAEAKIDENARKEEKKQQSLLDKDAAYKDALQDASNNATNRMNKAGASIKTIEQLGASLTEVAKLRTLSNKEGATKEQKDNFQIAFSNVLKDIATAAKSDPKVIEAYKQFFVLDDNKKAMKDADGNFIMKSINEAKTLRLSRRKEGIKIDQGEGLTELDVLAKGMSGFAESIIGKQGKTLSDIYRILDKGGPKGTEVTVKMLEAALASGKYNQYLDKGSVSDMQKTGFFNQDGSLKDNARELAIRSQQFNKDDVFNIGGQNYKVKKGHTESFFNPKAVRMAAGGYIKRADKGIAGMMGSQPYLVGERGPELFVPSSGGQIIPNNLMGPRFDVPSPTKYSGTNIVNSPSSNNIYNIDIDLNGTSVTAEDVLNSFKRELALVNAKEGRVRSLGGNY